MQCTHMDRHLKQAARRPQLRRASIGAWYVVSIYVCFSRVVRVWLRAGKEGGEGQTDRQCGVWGSSIHLCRHIPRGIHETLLSVFSSYYLNALRSPPDFPVYIGRCVIVGIVASLLLECFVFLSSCSSAFACCCPLPFSFFSSFFFFSRTLRWQRGSTTFSIRRWAV